MLGLRGQGWMNAVALASVLVLTGCGSTRQLRPVPVEDRGTSVTTAPEPSAAGPGVPALKPLPGAENAGKPGYYAVRPGDTLIRIGLDSGQNWRDIVRWNNLENPNVIEVGQVLRVAPPSAVVAAAPMTTEGGVVTRPVTTPSVTPSTTPPGQPASAAKPAASAAAPAAATAPAAAPAVVVGEDEMAFIWPAGGTLLASFDEIKNKGLDISGRAGEPVLAAADGRVVYSGAGLRGYGNLIILKHNNTYLTAYAHNQTLLVKEDQSVRKGQKIAEMGNSDADRVKLHFEIRRQGKPVDPAKYLPNR
ncbi:MAG TPA: peptidoglycan DD-metalloendopeptidase family protein [Burkholderiaceae bacterium]|nr:peptidoglycan DD-metalloendopeptidase family protein [Burkholderiaceae bacterium]